MGKHLRRRISAVLLGMAVLSSARLALAAEGYQESPLVSDVPSVAPLTDPVLLNAWGLVFAPGNALWISLNHDGALAAFRTDGRPLGSPVVVPMPGGGPGGSPTGLVLNDSDGFMISTGTQSLPSRLLTATEDGAIVGFNPALNPTQAFVVVDRSASGAVYKGLALARGVASGSYAADALPGSGQALLFAANFHAGQIEVFDSGFRMLRQFTDPSIPAGFAPFNVVNIGNRLFVTFAMQKLPDKMDDQAGAGNGYVVVFDTQGNVVRRFASQGALNSPWGVALAPENFGPAGGSLLIGNFGDGAINSFDFATGAYLGPLLDSSGNAIVVNGLWGLAFGRPVNVFAFGLGGTNGYPGNLLKVRLERSSLTPGPPVHIPPPPGSVGSSTLFVTAGPNDENDGLLGRVRATQ